MITYELAKQLKDAGFPQEKSDYGYYKHHERGIEIEHGDSATGEFLCDYPTLSELIEACVNINPAFTVSTTFGPLGWGNEKFEATALGVDTVTGSTPEEAVAKLYLELYA